MVDFAQSVIDELVDGVNAPYAVFSGHGLEIGSGDVGPGQEIVDLPVGVAVHDPGEHVGEMSERELARMRSRTAMVFQSFNLWPHLAVLQNVIEAPFMYRKSKGTRRLRVLKRYSKKSE